MNKNNDVSQVSEAGADSGQCSFDPFSDEVFAQAPEAYAELGKRCPLHRYQGRFDYFIASDPKDVKDNILMDYNMWTVQKGIGPKPQPEGIVAAGLSQETPNNRAARQAILQGFSTEGLLRLAPIIDQLADELIDDMLADPVGEGDFFSRFALPLPARLMCIMLGVPESDYLLYKQAADEMNEKVMNDPVPSSEFPYYMEIFERVRPYIDERRQLLASQGLEPDLQHVGTVLPDDFLSRFVCSSENGQPLADSDIVTLLLGVVIGGNETTISLIGTLLWQLLEQPERWQAIKENPELIEVAIEESLRLEPPLLGFMRSNRQVTELQNTTIPENSKVWYNIVAVNRDPELWPNPDEFCLDRPLSDLRQHVSFGRGGHLCVGARLARMEVKRVFEKLIKRMPNLRINGESTQAKATFHAWSKNYLPVKWS